MSLGSSNAILIEPAALGVKSRIALVYTYPLANLSLSSPARNNFTHPSGPQLASRGYRVLLLNNYNDRVGYESFVPDISRAIKYLRSLPGVDKVLLLGHSAGGPLVAFYQNVAENGPRACQGPEKIYMMTEDSITGVDWASSSTSAPTNVQGIGVPLLIMTMTCHYFVVPDEIIFDHAASKDKQIAYVEGASHGFTP